MGTKIQFYSVSTQQHAIPFPCTKKRAAKVLCLTIKILALFGLALLLACSAARRTALPAFPEKIGTNNVALGQNVYNEKELALKKGTPEYYHQIQLNLKEKKKDSITIELAPMNSGIRLGICKGKDILELEKNEIAIEPRKSVDIAELDSNGKIICIYTLSLVDIGKKDAILFIITFFPMPVI